MDWTAPLSIAVAAAILVTAIGALIRLVIGPLAGQNQIATGAVVVLVAVLLVAMIGVGARGEGGNWMENGGYW